jgi:hypothetical protein
MRGRSRCRRATPSRRIRCQSSPRRLKRSNTFVFPAPDMPLTNTPDTATNLDERGVRGLSHMRAVTRR